ncbi:26S proteasome complex subunit SEM1-like [Oppia nitens]|uniref:26S proteasome complex subunit SEM1-like n=1 Tax=Oppia nitens TaxID=1686743 RepID=UPI0023DA55E4|nr:26S proteasome complex subunit SEM1-like [Oppia nitens]
MADRIHKQTNGSKAKDNKMKDSKDTKADKSEQKVDLGLLEEDDEFEEFPAEVWKEKCDNEEDVNLWEDNWDDDNIEEDFSKQLKSELEKKTFA